MILWLYALPVLILSWLFFPFHSNTQALLGVEPNTSRILLLTAHPDDECMFFGPTLLALQQDELHPEIYSLTLSTGNADGLGEIRKEELSRSLDVLGIDQDKRWVIDHPMLQDNMTLQWDASVISVVIAPYVVKNHITTILTFDGQGISSHPNHYALPFGAWHLANSFLSKSPETSSESVLRIFSLSTVPVIPKYSGAFASLFRRANMLFDLIAPRSYNERAIFTSGFREYITTLQAMRQHESQLVWFRYLYVVFSRYMWVNEWVEIKPDDIFVLERK